MYPAIAARAFQTQLAYRGQLWAHTFGQLIQVFLKIAVWRAVFRHRAHVDGVVLEEMITYSVLAGSVISSWGWALLIHSVETAVKTGDIAVFLLKPISYPWYLFAAECGNLGFRVLAVAVPIIATVTITTGLLPPASAFHAVAAAGFFGLSFLILFLLSAACGLLAFWLMTAFSLEWILQGLLALFSGSFVPLWFFPDALASAVRLLPFAWVGFYPAAVYLGKLTAGAAAGYFALGAGWALLLAALVAGLWKMAAGRLVVQGG